MTNIWSFLMQTAEVTLAAYLLLLIKQIFSNKLSPRWQYGIWALLIPRILLPAGLSGKYLLPELPIFLEYCKTLAEAPLSSGYITAYTPIHTGFVLPWVTWAPLSITDWLFVLYVLGILVLLFKYAFVYIRLRFLLKKGMPLMADKKNRLEQVCDTYELKPCRAVSVPGLPSAFVCGVLKPVLALPDGCVTDDKVLLHELLHLRYHDSLQNIFWSLLRALNWCNPFMNDIFDRINSDMEALCDQRVMERIEGEERREYGRILLSMTNERYPHAPGTTSLSNGGKNISRRILSIARFKKYPKGMLLVSVCIAILLLPPTLVGVAAPGFHDMSYSTGTGFDYGMAMASARARRCTTPAGAIDTFAKALIYDNPVYYAAVTPLGEMEELVSRMDGKIREAQLACSQYLVYNLTGEADGGFRALLVLVMDSMAPPEGGYYYDEQGNPVNRGCYVYPIRVFKENGWVIKQTGQCQAAAGISESPLEYGSGNLPCLSSLEQMGSTGSIRIEEQVIAMVDNQLANNDQSFLFGSYYHFDGRAKPDAVFSQINSAYKVTYAFNGTAQERRSLRSAGIATVCADENGLPSEPVHLNMTGDTGGSRDGCTYTNRNVDETWDGLITDIDTEFHYTYPNDYDVLPNAYAIQVYWNGSLEETVTLERSDTK